MVRILSSFALTCVNGIPRVWGDGPGFARVQRLSRYFQYPAAVPRFRFCTPGSSIYLHQKRGVPFSDLCGETKRDSDVLYVHPDVPPRHHHRSPPCRSLNTLRYSIKSRQAMLPRAPWATLNWNIELLVLALRHFAILQYQYLSRLHLKTDPQINLRENSLINVS